MALSLILFLALCVCIGAFPSNQRYLYYNDVLDYDDAEKQCETLKGKTSLCRKNSLATIYDGKDEETLVKGLSRSQCRRSWIGDNTLTGLSYLSAKCPYTEKYCGVSGRAKCGRKTCYVCNNPDYAAGSSQIGHSYVSNDPHFRYCWRPALGTSHNFMGYPGCTYLYVTPCKKGKKGYKKVPFEVSATHQPWYNSNSVTGIKDLILKLYNSKTGTKCREFDLSKLETDKIADVLDGKTQNFYDNGRSFYLAKSWMSGTTKVISFELYVNYKKSKYCDYDLRIDADWRKGSGTFKWWNVNVRINFDKYLPPLGQEGTVCGLFGYLQKDRSLFYVKRKNLKKPIDPNRFNGLNRWGSSYLDPEKEDQCAYAVEVNNELENYDETPAAQKLLKERKAIEKCKNDAKNIEAVCLKKFNTVCKPLEKSGNCDLSKDMSKINFIKDCITDACGKCLKAYNNGLLNSIAAVLKLECAKGEAGGECRDYCADEAMNFGPGDKPKEFDDLHEDEFENDGDFQGVCYSNYDQQQVLNNNGITMDGYYYYLENYKYLIIFSIAIIIPVIFYYFFKKQHKDDSYQLLQN